jgi:hypothetical protein
MSTLHRLLPTEPRALAARLAGGRVVMATGMLAAPELTVRLLGADTATARRVTWLARMLAVRDAAIGLGGVVALRREGDARPWLVAGAVSDAVDAVVIAAAVRQGRVGGAGPAALVPGAAAVAAAGLVAAARLGN